MPPNNSSGRFLVRAVSRLPSARRLVLLACFLIAASSVFYTFQYLLLFSTVNVPAWNDDSGNDMVTFSSLDNVILGMWDHGSRNQPVTKDKDGREYKTSPGDLAKIERFCHSLRAAGSLASIVIFTTDDTLEDRLLVRYLASAIVFKPPLATRLGLYFFSSLRFSLYSAFLQRYKRFKNVMTADVMDVYFQADPFKTILVPPSSSSNTEASSSGGGSKDVVQVSEKRLLVAALEAESSRITRKSEGINGYWIASCFGNSALEQHFIGLPVSCSGTTIGTYQSMSAYTELVDYFSRSSFWCATQGTDQGVHNYVIRQYREQLNVVYQKLETGHVLTMDSVRTIRFDEDSGALLNEYGAEYAVVHQINRCATFAQTFLSGTKQGILEARRNSRNVVRPPVIPFNVTTKWTCRDVVWPPFMKERGVSYSEGNKSV